MISKVYHCRMSLQRLENYTGCSELKEETGFHHIALHLSDSLRSGEAEEEQGRSSLGALHQNGMMVMMWNGSEAGRRIGCDHCVVVAQAD